MSPVSHISPYQQPQGVAKYGLGRPWRERIDGEHMALTPGYLNMEGCDQRLPVQKETLPLHSVVRCCKLVARFLGLKSVKVTVLGSGNKWFRYSVSLQPTYCCIRGAANWMIKIDQMHLHHAYHFDHFEAEICGTNIFHTSMTYPPRSNVEPSLQNLQPSCITNNGRIRHRQGVTNNLSRRRPVKNFNLTWSNLTVFNCKWKKKKKKVGPSDRRMIKGKSYLIIKSLYLGDLCGTYK